MARRIFLSLSCALLTSAVGAAELGDVHVSSFIKQPLVAEIELTAFENPAAPLEARLAHPEVYRGANIGMPQVASTLSMSVVRRDGRQFLRLTSTAPVQSSHLHLYLELLDGASRNVRLVTLWLTPDPRPAPVPDPVPAPVPVPVPLPVPAAPATPVPVVSQASVEVQAPPPPKPKPRPVASPLAKKTPPLPIAPPPLHAPATCAAPATSDEPSACAVLDAKNMQLREQIGVLEDKVKLLQVAIGARPIEASQPKPAAAPKLRPIKTAAKPQSHDGAPWAGIAGASVALLALAGGLWLLWRRKKAGPVRMPGSALLPRLRQLLKRKKVAAPVEPSLE